MRAIYAFIVQGFRQQAAYKVEGWLGMFSGLAWFVLYASIWAALLHGDPAALQRQMGYVIASRCLAELFFLPTWEVAIKFRQGDIGLELIKPVALPVRILADFFGRNCFLVLRAVPVFTMIWILFRLPAPSLATVALFVVSALMGWVIVASMRMALNLIALWTVQFNEAEELFNLLSNLFSGVFIPLYFLPSWVAAFAKFLPFAGIFFTPSAILSGSLAGGALVQALLLQMLWALVGAGILGLMWQAGSRKLVMQGG